MFFFCFSFFLNQIKMDKSLLVNSLTKFSTNSTLLASGCATSPNPYIIDGKAAASASLFFDIFAVVGVFARC